MVENGISKNVRTRHAIVSGQILANLANQNDLLEDVALTCACACERINPDSTKKNGTPRWHIAKTLSLRGKRPDA